MTTQDADLHTPLISEQFLLYIHIPYCRHKCPYCDFNSYETQQAPDTEYIAALTKELCHYARQPEWRHRPVRSIYFGGGTPSLFSPNTLARFITAVNDLFPVDECSEITLEANPGTVLDEHMHQFHEIGVNRLSLGAQSFQPSTLRTLGRMHSPQDVVRAFTSARSAGFHNIALDLIYGVPEQSYVDLAHDLAQVVQLNPDHISAYCLSIEKNTPFFERIEKGIHDPVPEDLALRMTEKVNTELSRHGYERYEISNFAHPRKRAVHNAGYWEGYDYLGLGAGAHSYTVRHADMPLTAAARWSNVLNPDQYMQAAQRDGIAQHTHEELAFEALIFEFFFLGLRKIRGVSLDAFAERFGVSAFEVYPHLIHVLMDEGLLTLKDNYLALSARGLLLADSVIANFSEVGE